MTDHVFRLPAYPSTQARNSLSSSQKASLTSNISSSLLKTLALPPSKRDTPTSRTFLATYARDAAFNKLESLIWDQPISLSNDDKIIRKGSLLLAERLASSKLGLDIQTLVDLAIAYISIHPSHIRALFEADLKSLPSLVSTVKTDLVPAFTSLLSQPSGLYGLRKTIHCILSFIRAAPSELIRPFAQNKDFILALARVYDSGLASIAQSYGGMSVLQRADSRALDDWERIWIECKAAIVDSFHIVVSAMLQDLTLASGAALARESERTFDIVFTLLEYPSSSSSSTESLPATPFLNQPLLVDYQQSHDLSQTLSIALRQAAERDARLDLLEATLSSFETNSREPDGRKNPGVLKFILMSSGVVPGVDNPGRPRGVSKILDKGKAKAASSPFSNDLDMEVTQVLSILPDNSPEYIRALLAHSNYPFRGDAEKLIEALLDGTAPSPEALAAVEAQSQPDDGGDEFSRYVQHRQNAFDDEVMDLSQIRTGKKSNDAAAGLLRDRTFIEQMKADILRRAEEMSDDGDEDENDGNHGDIGGSSNAFDEDAELESKIKVLGDGEDSGEEDAVDSNSGGPSSPETILELAYIRDPKLLDRDSGTRRGQARVELKKETGWSDEQIEGWKIMLERNPRRDKILQKHEFSGNQQTVLEQSRGDSSRGRGHGGRGRGRGGGGDDSQARAWKDKNKASRGNHNRKRGHDKKMARAGGPS